MKPIYLSFHIGRGGHFNNPGFLTFLDEEDFQDLQRGLRDRIVLDNAAMDDYGQVTPGASVEDSWQLLDLTGRVLLQGREVSEAKTGRLDFDGEYDTYYVKEFDDLTDREIEVLWKEYLHDHTLMSDELKDALCTSKGKLRAKDIKHYPTKLLVTTQDEAERRTVTIDIDQQAGLFTRSKWRTDLDDLNFCPVSINAILDYMDSYCATNTEDFFAETDDEDEEY